MPEKTVIRKRTKAYTDQESPEVQPPQKNGSYLHVIKGLKRHDIDMEVTPKLANIGELERKIHESKRTQREYQRTDREQKEIQGIKDSYRLRKKGFRSNIGIIGLFSILCLSVYIIYASGILLRDQFTVEFDIANFIFYTFLFLLGIGAFIGGIRLARNVILVEHIFDSAFENEIYTRLEPALREVAAVQVELDEVHKKLDRIHLNVTRTREHPPLTDNPVKFIEAAVYVFLRYVILINVSVAVIIFIFLNPLYSNYVLTMLYPMWAIVITSEFKLWKTDVAMGWIIAPLGIIPTAIIFLDGVMQYSTLVGLIGLGLMIYSFAYRSWAKYYVEGKIPFSSVL